MNIDKKTDATENPLPVEPKEELRPANSWGMEAADERDAETVWRDAGWPQDAIDFTLGRTSKYRLSNGQTIECHRPVAGTARTKTGKRLYEIDRLLLDDLERQHKYTDVSDLKSRCVKKSDVRAKLATAEVVR
jgi:hypothetical protein